MDEKERMWKFLLDRRRETNRRSRNRLRTKLFNILGHFCVKCGFSDKRALQFDHKKGKGLKEVKKFKGNHEMYRYYVKHPDEAKKRLQVLCANCNWIKRAINKENRI